MMRSFLRVTVLVAALTLIGVCFLRAQTSRQASPDRQPGGDQSWFFETGLKAGDPFPEMSIFDAAGRPFNTRSLKGQYTVVINGCLT